MMLRLPPEDGESSSSTTFCVIEERIRTSARNLWKRAFSRKNAVAAEHGPRATTASDVGVRAMADRREGVGTG
jgi:hypothetical protein